MAGVSPWNYGNYYLGNTTMQMMPMMLNKVHQYGQIQAMSALGNAGLLGPRFGNTGLLGANFGNAGLLGAGFGNAGLLGASSMMPCCPAPSFSMPMAAPMMSCCPPSSFNFSSAAPMMAAATPLPVAFNPLVQGMYPMASMNPVNWMTPSSFMSALTSGPMPYRPPAFDFPSNVGAVMTIPYGTPNPLLASSPYGAFDSAPNFGNRSAGNSFYFSAPAANPVPSNVSYYPRPVSVPQPYPVPYPSPAAVPNVQQIPVPRNVSVVASPVVASNHPMPVSTGIPLWSSQGTFTDGPGGRPAVLASNNNSTTTAVATNRPINASLPVYDTTDKSHLLIGQPVTSSFSNVSLNNNNNRIGVTPSTAKNVKSFNRSHETLSSRIRRHMPTLPRLSRSNYTLNSFQTRRDPVLPPIVCGKLISDSGWLPKTSNLQSIPSTLSGKRGTQSLYTSNTGKSSFYSSSSVTSLLKRNRRRRHRSNSSASEYDCTICRQERDKRRLREHYDSSTLSSLLSSPTRSRRHHLSSSYSPSSSKVQSPLSYKRDSYKSHRRHPTEIKIKSTTRSSKKSSSPILLRTSSIPEQKSNTTIQEEKEDSSDDDSDDRTPDKENKENRLEKELSDDADSIDGKSDRYASKTTLKSIDD